MQSSSHSHLADSELAALNLQRRLLGTSALACTRQISVLFSH